MKENKSGCGIHLGNDGIKECSAISLENQTREFAIDESKLYTKYPYSDEWIEYGEITEKTDNRIKGTTKTGTFELKIETNKLDN